MSNIYTVWINSDETQLSGGYSEFETEEISPSDLHARLRQGKQVVMDIYVLQFFTEWLADMGGRLWACLGVAIISE